MLTQPLVSVTGFTMCCPEVSFLRARTHGSQEPSLLIGKLRYVRLAGTIFSAFPVQLLKILDLKTGSTRCFFYKVCHCGKEFTLLSVARNAYSRHILRVCLKYSVQQPVLSTCRLFHRASDIGKDAVLVLGIMTVFRCIVLLLYVSFPGER